MNAPTIMVAVSITAQTLKEVMSVVVKWDTH